MTIARVPVAATDPFVLADLCEHARIDVGTEDAAMTQMGRAASREIEAHAELALLRQEITWTLADCPGASVTLPIGPLYPDSAVTVNGLEMPPSALAPGLRPVLTLPAAVTTPITIVYEAGYGDDASDVPADLSIAIADQALQYYDQRGKEYSKRNQGLSLASSRITKRYRRVSV